MNLVPARASSPFYSFTLSAYYALHGYYYYYDSETTGFAFILHYYTHYGLDWGEWVNRNGILHMALLCRTAQLFTEHFRDICSGNFTGCYRKGEEGRCIFSDMYVFRYPLTICGEKKSNTNTNTKNSSSK